EIIHDVIWKRIESAVHHMWGGATQLNRVAIRSRAGDAAGADAPIRPADVFDDDGLSKRTSHAFGKYPANCIGNATPRERHDHRDGARRIGLRPYHGREGWQRGSTRGQLQKLTARKFHGGPPVSHAMVAALFARRRSARWTSDTATRRT